MRHIIKYWLPLYVYGAVIFYISSIPRALLVPPIPYFDKILHIIEYSLFGFLAVRAFRNSPRKLFYENFKMLAILVTLIYGTSDEVHQIFVPMREFSVFDIIADGIGGILGALMYGRDYTF